MEPMPEGAPARRSTGQEEPLPGSWLSELKVTNNSEELPETLFWILREKKCGNDIFFMNPLSNNISMRGNEY